MLITIREKNKVVTDIKVAVEIFRDILSYENEADRDKEHCWAIGLNVKNVILYVELISLGTLSNNLVHPREVFRTAILKAAASIIVGHNHPSGSLEISSEDRLITERLKQAGETLGIQLLDHIVIGNNNPEYISFKNKFWSIEKDKACSEASGHHDNKKDVIDRLDTERNDAVMYLYEIKTIEKMARLLYYDFSNISEIDWIPVLNIIERSTNLLDEKLTSMEELLLEVGK